MIKIGDEFLDLPTGTQIQRERNSPFFITATDSGTDAIPGEISYPFNFQLNEKNTRITKHPGMLQTNRQQAFDATLVNNDGGTPAKVILQETSAHLNRYHEGMQQAFLLNGASAFYKLIEDKLLRELSLGGTRTFIWDGYNLSGYGLWAHMNDTLNYTSSAQGDYVFYTIHNEGYLGNAVYQNQLQYTAGGYGITLSIVTEATKRSYCAHPYVSYVLKQCFLEHGYTVSGPILNDVDFNTLTMVSMRGIYIQMPEYPDDPSLNPKIILNQHVPPKKTIAEFLVELCKFLPIAFEFDNARKHCYIRTLTTKGLLKNVTPYMQAAVKRPNGEWNKKKKFGIKRDFGADSAELLSLSADAINEAVNHDDLPVPGFPSESLYRIVNENQYYQRNEGIGDALLIASNVQGYEPADATDFINSGISPLTMRRTISDEISPNVAGGEWIVPEMDQEGNWFGKPEPADWGFRFMFYKGRLFPVVKDSITFYAPWACNHNHKYILIGGNLVPVPLHSWSLGLEGGPSSMLEYWWKDWLKVLAEEDGLKGRCYLPLHEYLQLQWNDRIQVQNVNYIIRKIKDLLPYPGWFEFEAVRDGR